MRYRRCVFIVVCIMMSGYFLLSFGQDNLKRVEKTDDVFDQPALDDQKGEIQTRVYIKSDKESTIVAGSDDTVIDNENSKEGKKLQKKADKEEQKEQRKEFRQNMKGEGMSPGDVNNPEARKKMREQAGNMRQEIPAGSGPAGAVPQEPQKQVAGGQPASKPGVIEGLQKYMNSIVNKNLFLSLGSGRAAAKQAYVLTAVISNTDNADSKAIIEQIGGQRSFYVSKGEMVGGDATVLEIGEWGAKLDRSGEQIALKLGEGTRSGPMTGARGEGSMPKGEQKPGGEGKVGAPSRQVGSGGMGGIDPNSLPPFVKQILESRGISIEELQNNPELQQKLRAEFEGRSRGGRSGQGGEMRNERNR